MCALQYVNDFSRRTFPSLSTHNLAGVFIRVFSRRVKILYFIVINHSGIIYKNVFFGRGGETYQRKVSLISISLQTKFSWALYIKYNVIEIVQNGLHFVRIPFRNNNILYNELIQYLFHLLTLLLVLSDDLFWLIVRISEV